MLRCQKNDIERERGNCDYKFLYFGNTHAFNIVLQLPAAIKEIQRFGHRLDDSLLSQLFEQITTDWHYAEKEYSGHCLIQNHYIIIAGDLNGNVSQKAGGSRSHGEKGLEQVVRVAGYCTYIFMVY